MSAKAKAAKSSGGAKLNEVHLSMVGKDSQGNDKHVALAIHDLAAAKKFLSARGASELMAFLLELEQLAAKAISAYKDGDKIVINEQAIEALFADDTPLVPAAK